MLSFLASTWKENRDLFWIEENSFPISRICDMIAGWWGFQLRSVVRPGWLAFRIRL
jgi:hypothetical protein